MLEIDQEEFENLVADAVAHTPKPYHDRLDNIAFLVEDVPTVEQANKLKLAPNGLLFGLYEGVPLPDRGGTTKLLPDKITIFRLPLLAVSRTKVELKENIGRTVWHEIAHYFGLDHKHIRDLENR